MDGFWWIASTILQRIFSLCGWFEFEDRHIIFAAMTCHMTTVIDDVVIFPNGRWILCGNS
jgi:hypothetical protein